MTDDEVSEVCGELLGMARVCDEVESDHRGLVLSIAAVASGRARAYRHAAEILREAWERSREAAK